LNSLKSFNGFEVDKWSRRDSKQDLRPRGEAVYSLIVLWTHA